MIIENPVPVFFHWIGKAGLNWLLCVGVLLGIFAIIAFVFQLLR